ncbi:MAG: oligosaccharide flippase family protein [Scytonema sp. PMC 1069.18]|nr:oligosaccharide flippase family protein [Scytonema sp. PMC 1069.18]MEC4887061.1 oligosaccharide flippase family protein [Scytonema sp. PMC 1070.18]
MTSSSSKKVVKSGVWMTVSFALSKVAQLLAQIILARLLSPHDFGIWAMVLILNNFSVLFKDAAIAQVLVQRGLDNKNLVNTVYSLGVNISIALFGLQVLASWPLSWFFREPILLPLTAFLAVVFPISAGAGSHSAVMQQQMKFKELAFCEVFASSIRFGAAIACAFLGWGVWSFGVGEVAMTIVDSLLKRHLSRYRFTYSLKLDPVAIKQVKRFIVGIVSVSIAVQINTITDNLIIGRLISSQALGYYNLGYQLAMMPAYALSQVNRVILSALSQRDNTDKEIFLRQTLELYAIFSAPIYGLAFVVAPWIIPLLYGSSWVQAVKIFQIILIFAYARGFMSILGTTLLALNKAITNSAINWVLVPVSICSYFFGANAKGVEGVAIAVTLVMGIGATIWFWLATCYAAKWNILSLLRPVLLPTFAICVSLMLSFTLPIHQDINLYLQPIIVIFIYIIILSFFSLGRIPKKIITLMLAFSKK